MSKKLLIEKTINYYDLEGWKKWFSKIRFWDAPFVEVEALLPKEGFIVDLGCGEGIFTNFLGLSSPSRKILGVEIDEERLSQANHSLPNVSFKYGDVTKVKLPKSDAIILVHVLHHLTSFTDQEKVLIESCRALKNSGKLIIVEVEPKFSLKYFVTWFTDHFLVPWLFERKLYSPIFFRASEEWIRLLKRLGFACKVIAAEKGKPFTHVIIDCTKD